MSVEIKLKATKVLVLVGLPFKDRVYVEFDAPTPYPVMGYVATANFDVVEGYGVEWCRLALGVEPTEIINVK